MRHRITYIKHPDTDFNPDSINVSKDAISMEGLRATKEHRITLELEQIPKELKRLFEHTNEFHLRWVSSKPYKGRAPYVSRVSPGLHVFYAPGRRTRDEGLASSLQEVFGLQLKSLNNTEAFISRPSNSSADGPSPSQQFYGYVRSQSGLADHVKQHLCSASDRQCQNWAEGLQTTSSLDVDFEIASQALTVSSMWQEPAMDNSWNETIGRRVYGSEVEVGILSEETATSKEDVKLGGWLTVLGEDTKPKSTLFSFPSRHHAVAGAHFRTSFDVPIGLHPTLRLSMSIPTSANPTRHNPTCNLYTYLILPSQVFIDHYAFTDSLSLESHNLAALRKVSGATDLEAPDWAVKAWGSSSLFEIQRQHASIRDFDVTVPLHSRYLSPAPGGKAEVEIPYPTVFYACASTEEDSPSLSTNPFDRTNLGYDDFFGQRTIFHHIDPILPSAASNDKGPISGDSLALRLPIPVLDTEQAWLVEPVTALTVLIGSLWIAWKLFKPSRGGEVDAAAGVGAKKSQ